MLKSCVYLVVFVLASLLSPSRSMSINELIIANQTTSGASTSSTFASRPSGIPFPPFSLPANASFPWGSPFSTSSTSTSGTSTSITSSVTQSSTSSTTSTNAISSIAVAQTARATNTTPASPATLSSSSSRTPGIIGGVIGGLIALAILVVFFLVRSCLIRTRESDQLPRFQKFDRHPVTSGRRQVEPFINTAPGPGREKRGISGEQRDNVARLQVEPFTNTAPGPGREKRGISGEQGDNVARLQVQLRPVTPPQESPFVVELHRRIQELAEIVCPPDYAEAPNS